MKKMVMFLLGIFISIAMEAQNNKGFSDFEVKFMNFKYSLYEDLGDFTFPEMQDFGFLKEGEPLRVKIDQFFLENQEDILKYQRGLLEIYEIYAIDTSNFKRDTLFQEFANIYNETTEEFAVQMGDFFKINPMVYIGTIQNMLIARKYSAQEVGIKSLKNVIAWPKTATKKIGKGEWLIFVDEYDLAYLFELDLKEMEYKIRGIYERKK